MPANPDVRLVCHDYGDAAVLVDVVGDAYEDRWRAAQALGTALLTGGATGIVDVIATFQNVVAVFDPLLTDATAVRAVVDAEAGRAAPQWTPRELVVPVVYGGEHGPDLLDVADDLGLTPERVIEIHTTNTWTVRFTGSPAGAPFTDGPRFPRGVPRMAAPRARVVPGSVAVSGQQSTIYPAASPGGWRLIGRTPAALFHLRDEPPVPYRAGDTLRFVPIPASAWDDHTGPLMADQ